MLFLCQAVTFWTSPTDEWREVGVPRTYASNVGDDWNVQVPNRSFRKGYVIADAVKIART